MKKYILISLSVFFIFFACTKKMSYDGYIEEGSKSFKNKEYDDAIKYYSLALELEPDSAVAYNLIGMAYRFKYNQTHDRKYYAKQVQSFKESIELDPKYWVAMVNLGATYYYNNERDNAIPLFKRALELKPDHPEKYELEKMIKDYEDKKAKGK